MSSPVAPAVIPPVDVELLPADEARSRMDIGNAALKMLELVARTSGVPFKTQWAESDRVVTNMLEKVVFCELVYFNLRLNVSPSINGVDGPIGVIVITRTAGARVLNIVPSANGVSHVDVQCTFSRDSRVISVFAKVNFAIVEEPEVPSTVSFEISNVLDFDVAFGAGDAASDTELKEFDSFGFIKEAKAMRAQLIFYANVRSKAKDPNALCSILASEGILSGSVAGIQLRE